MKYNSTALHQSHRKLRELFSASVRIAKEEGWAELCNMLEAGESHAQWTLLKRTTPSTYVPLTSIAHPINGELPLNHHTSLGNLALHFSSSAIPPPCPPDHERKIMDNYNRRADYSQQSSLPTHISDGWNSKMFQY